MKRCLLLLLFAAPLYGQSIKLPPEVKVQPGRLAAVTVEWDGDSIDYASAPDLDVFREYDLNMAPASSFVDVGNGRFSDLEHFRKLFAAERPSVSSIESPDFQHVFFSKFRFWIFLSVRRSAFVGHISIVLCFCSQPEVCRIHAGRVVSAWAVVKNAEIVWDVAKSYLPRNPMGTLIFSDSCIGAEDSVTSVILSSGPEPASFIIWLLNLFPEAVCHRHLFQEHSSPVFSAAFYAAKFSSTPSHQAMSGGKSGLANTANYRYMNEHFLFLNKEGYLV